MLSFNCQSLSQHIVYTGCTTYAAHAASCHALVHSIIELAVIVIVMCDIRFKDLHANDRCGCKHQYIYTHTSAVYRVHANSVVSHCQIYMYTVQAYKIHMPSDIVLLIPETPL